MALALLLTLNVLSLCATTLPDYEWNEKDSLDVATHGASGAEESSRYQRHDWEGQGDDNVWIARKKDTESPATLARKSQPSELFIQVSQAHTSHNSINKDDGDGANHDNDNVMMVTGEVLINADIERKTPKAILKVQGGTSTHKNRSFNSKYVDKRWMVHKQRHAHSGSARGEATHLSLASAETPLLAASGTSTHSLLTPRIESHIPTTPPLTQDQVEASPLEVASIEVPLDDTAELIVLGLGEGETAAVKAEKDNMRIRVYCVMWALLLLFVYCACLGGKGEYSPYNPEADGEVWQSCMMAGEEKDVGKGGGLEAMARRGETYELSIHARLLKGRGGGISCEKDFLLRLAVAEEEEVEAKISVKTSTSKKAEMALDAVSKRVSYLRDTCHGQAWEIDAGLTSVDSYIYLTMVLSMAPKCLLLLPLALCHIPVCFLFWVYSSRSISGSTLTETTRRDDGIGISYFQLLLFLVCGLPAWILVGLSLLYDMLTISIWGALYCAVTCRWAAVAASQEAIRPYKGGPALYNYIPDAIRAVRGECQRQSYIGTMWSLVVMWLTAPYIKYHVNCNPWCYDLQSRFVQQISTSMQDVGTGQRVDDINHLDRNECNVAQIQAQYMKLSSDCSISLEDSSIWAQMHHYPYPLDDSTSLTELEPPSDDAKSLGSRRAWGLGFQHAPRGSFFGGSLLLCHATHVAGQNYEDENRQEEQLEKDFTTISNSCESPIYRILYWHNNPFHTLTGLSEVSISNGEKQCPQKRYGIEHPMWLVTGHSPLLADRNSRAGSGIVTASNDNWLPKFLFEWRYSYFKQLFSENMARHTAEEKALHYACQQFQETSDVHLHLEGTTAGTGEEGKAGKNPIDAQSGSVMNETLASQGVFLTNENKSWLKTRANISATLNQQHDHAVSTPRTHVGSQRSPNKGMARRRQADIWDENAIHIDIDNIDINTMSYTKYC